jgi:hypothetical protein
LRLMDEDRAERLIRAIAHRLEGELSEIEL